VDLAILVHLREVPSTPDENNDRSDRVVNGVDVAR
jgi:hypothetical protein